MAWRKGPGGQAYDGVHYAVTNLTLANRKLKANGSDPVARRQAVHACKFLGEAASAGLLALPIPDSAAQSLYSQMLSSFQQAAICSQTGLETLDAKQLQRGSDALAEASSYAQKLTLRIHHLS